MGLGIREARNNLPSLIRRATEQEEEIQLGSRGADEVTLVATRKYRRMQEEVSRLMAEVDTLRDRLAQVSAEGAAVAGRERAFAGLQRALESGQLRTGGGPAAPRVRRYMEDYAATSAADREARIRFGGDTAQPAFQRTTPRA
jgi:PHD/YefM family antitoxin component YafN of YafNO toxin-antitoxin module